MLIRSVKNYIYVQNHSEHLEQNLDIKNIIPIEKRAFEQ